MTVSPLLKRVVGDIRFWILLYFVIRLIGITNPPIEVSQSWRQAIVNMTARNFLEESSNILYPTLDHSGNKSGISAMEFPLLNYIIYLFHLVFGYEHWYGRIINLITSSFGVCFFYKFLKITSTTKTAFWAGFLLLNTLWFSYSQKIMPDTFSCSLVLMAIYFGYRYFLESKKNQLLLFGVLLSIGILCKITAGAILLLLVPPVLLSPTRIKRKAMLALVAIVAAIPVVWWYFVWMPHLYSLSGFLPINYHGTSTIENFENFRNNTFQIIKTILVSTMKFVGFFLLVVGMVVAVLKKNKKLILLLGLNVLGVIVIILKTPELQRHSYYLLPFIPFFAYTAAHAFIAINKKWMLVVLGSAVLIDGIASQFHNLHLKEKNLYRLELEEIADKVASDEKLIVINGGDNPSDIYFTNRKGWTIPNEKVSAKYLKELKSKGALYFYCLACEKEWESYEKVYTNEWLSVYKL